MIVWPADVGDALGKLGQQIVALPHPVRVPGWRRGQLEICRALAILAQTREVSDNLVRREA